ncbi:MAG TPA: ATP synthase subunit I [Rhodanobacteraceae bacterium]
MDNSLAGGRRLAAKVILTQAVVALIVGLAFLARDVPSAIGALAGGLVAAVGSAMLALRVFARAATGPTAMLARFVVGSALKWIVVIVGLYLIVAVWKLPAMPVFAGLVAAMLVTVASLKFER